MARAAASDPTPGESDLLAALNRDAARGQTGVPCGFHLLRQRLSPQLLARVDEIVVAIREDRASLRQGRYSASWLADTLTAHGFPIGDQSVQKHVAKRCRCGY